MRHPRRSARRPSSGAIVGAALCTALAGAATGVSRLVPILSAPVIGLILGVVVAVVLAPPASLRVGIAFCSHRVLQVGVASLGLQLSLGTALGVGARSLPVLVGTLVICLVATVLVGRMLRVPASLRTLVGVGTAICGASAIAAVTPLIDAAAADVTYALTTVFVFNGVAVVLFPVLGHALSLSQQAFGLFAGTAINDTSSVAAAGYAFGTDAGQHAIVVKLTRALFIVPICLVLALRRAGPARIGMRSVTEWVPWFLVAFVVISAAVSVMPPTAAVRNAFAAVSVFLITIALAAIGLTTDPRSLRSTGPRPLLLGALLWVVVSVSSLAIAAATGVR